jgi:cytosine/adenosine deaminase-related metal-dependent hydrolase
MARHFLGATMIRHWLLGLALCAAVTAAPAQHTDRYVVLFQGKASGTQTTVVKADGSITVDYSYRDNGRGPDVKEEFAFDRAGVPLRHRLSGKSTYGGPIDETYERDGAQARWQSVADRGATQVTQPSWYWPISEASPEGLAQLVRAALKRPDRRVPLLPSGTATVEKLHEQVFSAGGKRQAAALYAVSGLDFDPDYVWLTAGRAPKLFAEVVPGYFLTVPAGWEAIGRELERAQLDAQARQLAALVPRLAHRLPEPILIRNARVFDSERARLGPAQDVYVQRGRIAAVVPAGTPAREPGTVIDAANRVLLPGLFDMHDHADPWRGVLQIAGGVTTVRDMANDNAVLWDQIRRIDAGAAIGPRVIPAGFIEGQSEHSSKSGFVADSIDAVRAAIDWYAQRGYPQIKLYNSFRREWVAETTAYAHQRGLRVSGHVPAFMRAEEVVQLGYDELQHINQLALNFLVGPQDDTRTLLRFYLVLEKAHALDLDDKRTRKFLKLLRDRGTVVDPTAATFEDMYQRQGEPHPAYASVIDHLPAAVQRNLHMTGFDVTDANVARYKASYEKLLELIGRMHRAGIPLLAGTDATAGFALHRELELYVKAGVPAAEALRIATWNGAKYTRTLDRLGSIEPGKLADLILVDGDPTANIADVRRIGLVMKEGAVYYPAEVYPAVGVKPFVDRIPYFATP